jgi:hypothetical protein
MSSPNHVTAESLIRQPGQERAPLMYRRIPPCYMSTGMYSHARPEKIEVKDHQIWVEHDKEIHYD